MIFDDADLREEIEQMFAEEQAKAYYIARKKRNLPPGYYDNKPPLHYPDKDKEK